MIRAWLLAPWLLLPLAAMAQGTVQRCVGADGSPVFTDRPCSALQAAPLRPVLATSAAAAGATPAAALTCATTVGQLRQALLAAFASHRADQLSGLMLWQGYDDRQARERIQQLQSLLRQPLLGVRQDGPALLVSTPSEQADGQPRQSRFALRQQAGCLWLDPPD